MPLGIAAGLAIGLGIIRQRERSVWVFGIFLQGDPGRLWQIGRGLIYPPRLSGAVDMELLTFSAEPGSSQTTHPETPRESPL
jgi:hypothetical protein